VTAEASADISKLTAALNKTAQQAQTTTHQVLVESANYIKAEMEAKVPVRTGKLRNSISIQVETDRVIIGPNLQMAPYAGYVEFGTKPHEIRPKNPGGVLAFKMGGRMVFARKVNHPGTRAQPYVKPAFEAWVDSLGTMAAEANIKVLKTNAP
jgi:HK97 gp10 family phage protein